MRIISGLMIVLLLAAVVMAAPHVCPSEQAASKGMTAFEVFHTVVAPCWHGAYPAKDYGLLIAAGPKFDSAFGGIAAMEANMKNKVRKANFLLHREELAKLVTAYAKAATANDSIEVYKLLPALHEEFEQAAHACLPAAFPELEGAIITTTVIVDTHIPAKNMEGLTGSTETLVTKFNALDEKVLPKELGEYKEEVLKKFADWQIQAKELQTLLTKNELETYGTKAIELKTQLAEFCETYL